jgi:hypothetical protein
VLALGRDAVNGEAPDSSIRSTDGHLSGAEGTRRCEVTPGVNPACL